MADHHHTAMTLEDDDGNRLHLRWSRSGRTLIATVWDENFAAFRQVSLLPAQIERLIGFLTDSLEERRTSK